MGVTSSMGRLGGLVGAAAGVVFLLSGIFTLIALPQGAPSSFGGYLLGVLLDAAFLPMLFAALFVVGLSETFLEHSRATCKRVLPRSYNRNIKAGAHSGLCGD